MCDLIDIQYTELTFFLHSSKIHLNYLAQMRIEIILSFEMGDFHLTGE